MNDAGSRGLKASSHQTGSSIRKVAIASFIGTTIEWYDFFLYGTATALIFGRLFFPNYDPLTGTLASFGTYAVGFAARPIGGIVCGHYGDKIGRKSMLILTLLIMGIATFLIGCLPTYSQIGIWAPILLVVLRVAQGFGVGGEESGGPPRQSLSMDRVPSAPSAVGPFPLNWVIDTPDLMRRLPDGWRDWISMRSLRPAATAWLRPRAKDVRINAGRNIVSARPQNGRITLPLDDGAMITGDHVLLATGYRIDVAKFGIFSPNLLTRIETVAGYPKLASGLESSMPRLHFVGSTAVRSI